MSNNPNNTPPQSPQSGENIEDAVKKFFGRNFDKYLSKIFPDSLSGDSNEFKNFVKFFQKDVIETEQMYGRFSREMKSIFKKQYPDIMDSEFDKVFDNYKKDFYNKVVQRVTERHQLLIEHQKILEKRYEAPLSSDVRVTIKKFSISDLRDANASPKALKRVYEKYGVDTEIDLRLIVPDLEKLLSKIGGTKDNLTNEEKMLLNEEMESFLIRQIPTEKMISLLLKTINVSNKPEVVEMFEILMPTMTMENIREYLIDSSEELGQFEFFLYEKFLNIYSIPVPVYPHLTNKEKEDFSLFKQILYVNNNNEIKIPTDIVKDFIHSSSHSFNDRMFDVIILNNGLKEEFVKSLQNNFKDREKEREVAEIIRDKTIMIRALQEEIQKLDENLKDKIGFDWENQEFWKNNFVNGSYFSLKNESGKETYWKILWFSDGKDENPGSIEMSEQKLVNDNNLSYKWIDGDNISLNYQDFVEIFIWKVRDLGITDIKISDTDPEVPDIIEELEFSDRQAFIAELDIIDEDGLGKWFDKDMIIGVNSEKRSEYVRITGINDTDQTISIELFDGKKIPGSEGFPNPISWMDFIEMIRWESANFRRIGKMDTVYEFAENFAFMPENRSIGPLQKIKDKNLFVKNWKLYLSEEIDGQKKENELLGFKNDETGTLVEIRQFGAGEIEISVIQYKNLKELGEEKESPNDASVQKKSQIKANNLRKRKIKLKPQKLKTHTVMQLLQHYGATTPVNITAGKQFLEEFEEKNNIIHGNDLKKEASVSHGWSIAHLYYMYKNAKSYFEQYMKDKADMDSAYAFINMPGNLGITGIDYMAQLIDGTVNSVKKKYMGAERRKYIMENIIGPKAKPKPHEVLAGLMLVYDMSGTLYPDTKLQDLQWTKYLWFEKVCNALGLHPQHELAICYNKEAANREWVREHIPEEELIKRLFKMHQGTNRMIQAIGGGAKIWKMAEAGKQAQIEKWGKEVKEEASESGGRAEYMIAKFGSNEFEIALWAFPRMMDKSTSPQHLWVIFSFVMWGAPNYVHYSISDQFRGYGYGGVAFHAVPFVNNKENGTLYRDIVELSLRYRKNKNYPWADTMLSEYEEIMKKMPTDPFQHVDRTSSGGKSGDADRYKDLYNFWKKHHKTLHFILQGTDPLLQTAFMDDSDDINSDEKKKIQKYFDVFYGNTTDYMLKNGGLKNAAKDHMLGSTGTLNADSSMLFMPSSEGFQYRSLKAYLGEIKFDGESGGALSGWDRDNILFPKVVRFLDIIRDNETFRNNPEYQKKQFEMSFMEIWWKISGKILQNQKTKPDYEHMVATADGYSYLQRLKKSYNFDISYESVLAFAVEWKQDAPEHKAKRREVMDAVYNTFILRSSTHATSSTIQNRIDRTLTSYNSDNISLQ